MSRTVKSAEPTTSSKPPRFVNPNSVPVGLYDESGRKVYVAPFADVGTKHENSTALYVLEGEFFRPQVHPHGSLVPHPADHELVQEVADEQVIENVNRQRSSLGMEPVSGEGSAAAGAAVVTADVAETPTGTGPVAEVGTSVATDPAVTVTGNGEHVEPTGQEPGPETKSHIKSKVHVAPFKPHSKK